MTKKSSQKIAQKNLKLRDQLWPKITDEMLWNRKNKKGFTTIPRTLPHFFRIMDDLSSGQPLSATYFVLWCRAFDEHVVTISNPRDFAFESGFSGQRAEQTWRGRMKKLKELGFILAAEGASGEFNYVLILNPYYVVKELKDQISHARYNTLIERSQNIGADDLLE